MLHPDFLLEKLSSYQIAEWEVYNRLDPIGTWREDFRMANTICYIMNIVSHLYAKKGTTPQMYKPETFMPDWAGDKEKENLLKQSTEQMKGFLLAFAKSQNKQVKKQLRQDPPKRVNRRRNNEHRSVNS